MNVETPIRCRARAASIWPTCPCSACRTQARRMRKMKAAGLYVRTPNEVAWAVIDTLTGRGWTSQAIASATDIPWPTVQGWLTRDREGHRTLISPGHASQLVRHGTPTAGSIGTTGSTRRLRALAAMGWGLGELAEQTWVNFSTLATVRGGSTTRIAVAKANEIDRLFNELHLTVGPSGRARQHAVTRRWLPPLAWDDIDDLKERPRTGIHSNRTLKTDVDDVVVERVLSGQIIQCTYGEKVEVMRRAGLRGISKKEICSRMGWREGRYAMDVAA